MKAPMRARGELASSRLVSLRKRAIEKTAWVSVSETTSRSAIYPLIRRGNSRGRQPLIR